MTANASVNSGKKYNVHELFDEVLGRHLERLIGTRYGIDGLPLNLTVVSCLVMLMERDKEIDGTSSGLSDRYTLEALSADMEEMGFDPDGNMAVTVQEMAQKGYIQIEDGRLIPQKPAVSMSRLLEKIFPRMPGLNLVGYFIQTLDEVRSGRKGLDAAAGQFDQILDKQGISLKKEKQVTPKGKLEDSKILRRAQIGNRPEDHGAFSPEPKILSSDQYARKVQIQKVDFGRSIASEEESPATVPEKDEGRDSVEAESADLEKETAAATEPSDTTASEDPTTNETASCLQVESEVPDAPEQENNLAESPESIEYDAFARQKSETRDADEPEAELDICIENEISESEDSLIEKRIADFEEDLAMQCPMCRRSKVQVEMTAKGKTYYKCAQNACYFISWGKPHHVPCPQCNNPFLVEANPTGKRILKCPRATCRYEHQPSPESIPTLPAGVDAAPATIQKTSANKRRPRRKVKKRKGVRRKKQK